MRVNFDRDAKPNFHCAEVTFLAAFLVNCELNKIIDLNNSGRTTSAEQRARNRPEDLSLDFTRDKFSHVMRESTGDDNDSDIMF